MPTEPASTQVTDAQAHQNQQTDQTTKVPPEQFDARRAFDATNERVNKISQKLEKFDPEVLAQIADKLGVTPKEAEKKIDAKTPDVREVTKQVLWEDKNAERIAKANKDGAYDTYIQEGIKPDRALRLAEQDQGIQVDTSGQTRQNRASAADASVDRSGPPPGNFKTGQYGIKDEDIEKYGEEASRMIIHR